MHEPPIASPFGSYEPEKPMPVSPTLLIVACLFLISGVGASAESFVKLFHLHFSINLAFVNLFIGIGLLFRKPRSLQWALFVTWLGLICLPIVLILSLFMPWSGQWQIYGQELGQIPRSMGDAFNFSLFGLMFWQYRVLSNPATRGLFVQRSR